MNLSALPVTYQKTKLQSFIIDSETFPTAVQTIGKALNMEFSIAVDLRKEDRRRTDSLFKGESINGIYKKSKGRATSVSLRQAIFYTSIYDHSGCCIFVDGTERWKYQFGYVN